MGRRKLPHPRALTALAVAASLTVVSCARGADAPPTRPPVYPSPIASAVPNPPTPQPSPTPDPVGPAPSDIAAARAAFDRLERTIGPCNEQVVARWGITCALGDIDGDLAADTAILLPLIQPAPLGPHPGAVFVSLSSAPGYVALTPPGAADTSILGKAVFSLSDRDGLPRPEVAFLENLCTATHCASLVRVHTWDGSTWRDIGPVDQGITAIDEIAFEGSGASTAIVMHNQPSSGPLAGPTRSGTYRYTLRSGRFALSETRYDPPEYLFHAILDADALFARGDWNEAIEAYEAAIQDPDLRDWRAENDRGASRDALVTYALFRIAVATAAMGNDADPAIDRVIREGKGLVFLNTAEAFRKGYQERGSVIGGCLEATRYLATTGPGIDTPRHVQRLMDHGYANLQYTYRDICPL